MDDLTDCRLCVETVRGDFEALLTLASSKIDLPEGDLIDVTNVDATGRAIFVKAMPEFVPEAGGQPWFKIRGQVTNLAALMRTTPLTRPF